MQKNNGLTLVVAAIIQRPKPGQLTEKEVLIVRRGPEMSGAGAWEFPGGKVERGESEPQALQREILEELDIKIRVGAKCGETIHQYATKKVHLKFYLVEMPPHEHIVLSEHDQLKWIHLDLIDPMELSEADRPILETLKTR